MIMQANEDKQLLIESMRKLTSHISNNVKRQGDIFNSLSLPDLEKIIFNLQDSNENLRKISALLLCEMAYRSQQIKKRMANMLKLYPSEGRICLGGFPNLIANFPMAVKNCFNLIKMQPKQAQPDKFCWIINLDHKIAQIQYLDFKNYSSHTFFDPKRTLFGFTIISNKKTDRASPLADKKQGGLITPLKMSFNLNRSIHFNDTHKTRPSKQKIEQGQKEIQTDRKSNDAAHRSKILTLFQERKGRLYTQY